MEETKSGERAGLACPPRAPAVALLPGLIQGCLPGSSRLGDGGVRGEVQPMCPHLPGCPAFAFSPGCPAFCLRMVESEFSAPQGRF